MKPRRCSLLLVGLVAQMALLASRSFAVEATLTDDVSVDLSSGLPKKPNGASPVLRVRGDEQRVYLKFDVASVMPANLESSGVKAVLKFFVTRVDRPGKLRISKPGVTVMSRAATWSEDAEAEVQNLTSEAPASERVITDKEVTRAKSFITVDVTALLTSVRSDLPPVTFIITGEGDTAVNLDSKESTGTSHPATLQLIEPAPLR